MRYKDMVPAVEELVRRFSGPATAPLVRGKDLLEGMTSEQMRPATPPSKYAVRVDRWTRRRGEELYEASPVLRGQLGAMDDGPVAAADLFAMGFEPAPDLVEACTDMVRLEYLRTLAADAEYQALHQTIQGDVIACEVAAIHFAAGLAAAKKSHPEPPSGETPRQKALREAREGIAMRAAAAKAVAAAREEVNELSDLREACGIGKGQEASATKDLQRVRELFSRLRSSPKLWRILELAGRFRRAAKAKQARKPRHGVDEVVGVTLGDDLARVLPHELAALDDPDLEMEALLRLAERRLGQWEVTAPMPEARGPIVVSVDESGSMDGPKGESAKALALAMAWIARSQKRYCGLVSYSGGKGYRMHAIPPGGGDPLGLMEWAVGWLGGGTAVDVPLTEMPEIHQALQAPEGKTDVLFLTDSICSVSASAEQAFNAWKARTKARLITLVIGNPGGGGSLARVSDELHQVPCLEAGGEAVGRALSI
jgi:uncharacterized protein with von Willebrand factor type A (vWA) domain